MMNTLGFFSFGCKKRIREREATEGQDGKPEAGGEKKMSDKK